MLVLNPAIAGAINAHSNGGPVVVAQGNLTIHLGHDVVIPEGGQIPVRVVIPAKAGIQTNLSTAPTRRFVVTDFGHLASTPARAALDK